MRTFIGVLLCVGSMLLAACGDDSAGGDGGHRAAAEVGPCELLSNDLLAAHFSLPQDDTIRRQPSKYSPHPLCMVSWKKPGAADMSVRQQAEMRDYLQKKMRGEGASKPIDRSSSEVTLTVFRPRFDSQEAALVGFNSAMRRLESGVRTEVADTQINFQADLEPVDGIGDRARWAPRLNQLSLVSGRDIFHLTVNTGADKATHRALAESLARDLLASF